MLTELLQGKASDSPEPVPNVYVPTGEERYAVLWFATQGILGYHESAEAIEEAFHGLACAISNTSPVTILSLRSLNMILKGIYREATADFEALGVEHEASNVVPIHKETVN